MEHVEIMLKTASEQQTEGELVYLFATRKTFCFKQKDAFFARPKNTTKKKFVVAATKKNCTIFTTHENYFVGNVCLLYTNCCL